MHLRGLNKLQSLNLSLTQVTDAGLLHLQGMTQLEVLDLTGTQVTDDKAIFAQPISLYAFACSDTVPCDFLYPGFV